LPDDEVEESENSLKADEDDISIIRTMRVEANRLSSILDKLEKLPPKKRLAMTECFNHILETAVK